MKTIIINLSDILKVDIKKSIRAFIDLRKENAGRLCGLSACAPTLFGVTDSAYVQGALFIANRGVIPKYRAGKMTTEKFMTDCLRYHFPEPADYAGNWNDALRNAWNAMLEIDEQKIADFVSVLKSNQDMQFILITNSNEMHIDFVIQKFQAFGVNFMFNEENSYFENQNLILYSSHKVGEFKTSGMIQKIAQEQVLEPKDTIVCTGYDNDLVLAKALKFDTVKIGHNFDYANIESYLNQKDIHHVKIL